MTYTKTKEKKTMKILYTLMITALLSMMVGAQSRVTPGDTLNISIKGVPQEEQSQISGPYVVNASGQLKLPYIKGYVSASGSTSTVARRIEAAYKAAKIYTTPTITINSMRETAATQTKIQKFVTVAGQVARSGPIAYRPGMTLGEAVATSAPNTFAALNRVELLRNGRVYKYNVKLASHKMLKVYANDQINVPQQNMFGK